MPEYIEERHYLPDGMKPDDINYAFQVHVAYKGYGKWAVESLGSHFRDTEETL